jgi:hypothetical protein
LRKKPVTPPEPLTDVAPLITIRSSCQACWSLLALPGAGISVWPFCPRRQSWRCS